MSIIERVKKMSESIASGFICEINTMETRDEFANMMLEWMLGLHLFNEVRVVCDELNNPPEMVDNGDFIADIYFKTPEMANEAHLTLRVEKAPPRLLGVFVCKEAEE